MKCPKCQHENREGARFCLKCGAKLENLCHKCGAKLPPGARFCDECGAKIGEAELKIPIPKLEDAYTHLQSVMPGSLAVKLQSAPPDMEGENRIISILFGDIGNSVGITEKMAPENAAELINECVNVMVDIILKYEGSINRYIGDCVLAFFGTPTVHENDPERAILAALEMREAVSKLNLSIKIGINTGVVYVGSMGPEAHREFAAMGAAVNLASRLQQSATEPGQILAGESTYRQTRRSFEFKPLPPMAIRGISEPVRAYEVIKPLPRPEKIRGIEGLRAEIIGRDRELADLKESVDEALRGRGQIVTISGEAGVGKTRLVSELKGYIRDKNIRWLEGRCVSIGEFTGYWVFIDILRSYLGFSGDDTGESLEERIISSMQVLFPQQWEDIIPYVGNILSVKFGNQWDEKIRYMPPEQMKYQIFLTLRSIFLALAQQKPLLLIFEDLHWGDNLSLDLINLLMDDLILAPLMLLCVYRPEKEHKSWHISSQASGKCLDRYREITLRALNPQDSRRLVAALLDIENLPEAVRESIIQKSDGNPFFVEEVIRSLIESGAVYRDGERWVAKGEAESLAVPDTIQSVIMARIDRLEEEVRYVLQSAAVIGRLFRHRLLQYTTQQEQNLDGYLWKLEDRDLVYEERAIPELEYSFRHVLTQETAYNTILSRRRREFHHKVAEGYEVLYSDRLEEYYDDLAYHYSRSDDHRKAVQYLIKAGQKARRGYSNDVAIAHYQKALEVIEQEKIEENEWKLEALQGLGEVYDGTNRQVEAVEIFEKAIATAKEMKLPSRRIVRLYSLITESLYWLRMGDKMLSYAKMGLEKLGNDTDCLEAVFMNDRIALWYEDFMYDKERLKENIDKNKAIIKRLPYSLELRPPYNRIIIFAIYYDNDLDSAYEWAKELEKHAIQHNDIRGIAESWNYQGDILIHNGNYKTGIPYMQRAIDTLEHIGDNMRTLYMRRGIIYNFLMMGDIDEAETHAKAILKISENQSSDPTLSEHYLWHFIEIIRQNYDKALTHLQKMLEDFQLHKRIGWIVQIYGYLGIVYMKKDDYNQAIQNFELSMKTIMESSDESLISLTYNFPLLFLKEAYEAIPVPNKYREYCLSLKERYADVIDKLPWFKWDIEPAQPSKEYRKLIFGDNFQGKVDESWNWIDEFGDCSYHVTGDGVEIHSANGRNLSGTNNSAPRLMREISGDFAVETIVSPVSDEKPYIGGILLWKDKDNFLQLEKGYWGKRTVRYGGRIDGKLYNCSRGFLPSAADDIYLRLEHSKGKFHAYCNDGKEWLSCGETELQTEGTFQVGIYAYGMIDRHIYCSEYNEGTATLFRNFRIWTR